MVKVKSNVSLSTLRVETLYKAWTLIVSLLTKMMLQYRHKNKKVLLGATG